MGRAGKPPPLPTSSTVFAPRSESARAAKSVSDYIRNNINPDFTGDDEIQLFGYIGDNYIIFTDEPFHGRQAYALFYTEDGENWTELSAIPQRLMQLTGGSAWSIKALPCQTQAAPA